MTKETILHLDFKLDQLTMRCTKIFDAKNLTIYAADDTHAVYGRIYEGHRA